MSTAKATPVTYLLIGLSAIALVAFSIATYQLRTETVVVRSGIREKREEMELVSKILQEQAIRIQAITLSHRLLSQDRIDYLNAQDPPTIKAMTAFFRRSTDIITKSM